jgi:hypothetical protein
MPSTALIGVEPDELGWLRLLLFLLRHPDPCVPELTRQALLYLEEAAGSGTGPQDRRPGGLPHRATL